MPEGDMVRMVAARLDRALAGHRLVRGELRWPTVAVGDLAGRSVLHTRPFGKHLLTRLDDGRTLHSHLRMDGRWQVLATDAPAARARSPRVRAVLDDGAITALGVDLGMLDLVPTSQEHRLVGHLGPDILDDGFDWAEGAPGPGLAEAVARWAAQGDRPVCAVLLDQRVVAGVGTIWLAESLFAEQVHPWAAASDVDPVVVVRTARRLMQESVASGAPTVQVHDCKGWPCPRCGTPIARGTTRGPQERPVFWCPSCQRAHNPTRQR